MIVASVQVVVLFVLHLIALVMCVVALVDAARRPATAFTNAGKRTKGFWLAVLGVATAVAFVAIPYPLGIGALGFFAAALAAAAAGVYLADVRPAVGPYSGTGSGGWGPRGRGPGGRGPGGRGGGW